MQVLIHSCTFSVMDQHITNQCFLPPKHQATENSCLIDHLPLSHVFICLHPSWTVKWKNQIHFVLSYTAWVLSFTLWVYSKPWVQLGRVLHDLGGSSCFPTALISRQDRDGFFKCAIKVSLGLPSSSMKAFHLDFQHGRGMAMFRIQPWIIQLSWICLTSWVLILI